MWILGVKIINEQGKQNGFAKYPRMISAISGFFGKSESAAPEPVSQEKKNAGNAAQVFSYGIGVGSR